MKRALLVAAILILQAGTALAAPQIKLPECDVVNAWAGQVNPADTYSIAPQLNMPRAFDDSRLVPVFGVPALSWTVEDVQAASQAMVKCYQEAGKRRDAIVANALAAANRTLGGTLPRFNAALQKSKADADAAKKEIDALPNSAELDRALEALLKSNPAAPDGNAYRGLPRELVEPVWRLARAVPMLANNEREPIYKALGERRATIQAGLSDEAGKAIAAAPADASGVLGVMEARQRLAAIGDAATKSRMEQSADQRLKQIRDALRQAKPAAWVPPDCVDLYRWSGATNATAGVGLAGRSLMTAFLDERAVPLFGLSIADWSDQDMTKFKSLRVLCQGQAQALAAMPGGANSELVQLANRGRWVDGADQQIADAKLTVTAYRQAQQAVAVATAKVEALPNTAASLVPLSQLANDPAQAQVSQEDRVKFANVINAKRAAIGAQATEAAVKGLADVKVASLADLGKLWTYAVQAGGTIPDQRGQQTFFGAFSKAMDEAAGKMLPEFQSKLAALPASIEGIGQANMAVAKLTGVADIGRLPAFTAYREAAKTRTDAIVKTVRTEACDGLLSSLSVGSDAKLEVWDGYKARSLGDFLCGLAENANTVNAYSGAGMFSSTTTLKLTPHMESLQTVSLHKAEVQAGKPMLIGFQIKDANQERKLSVEEWEQIARVSVVGHMSDLSYFCKRLENTVPDKLPAADRILWLRCALHAGGLDDRGR
ncbi:MAG: hypothetical protein HY246_22945 [Proteobacteria bacterium]|nr:hypothetical protein [Pseudomonadota bacterium]